MAKRFALLSFGVLCLALVGCATGLKLTNAERSEKASRVVPVPSSETVSLVSDFLMGEGYSIDKFEESTGILQTHWSHSSNAVMESLLGSNIEQKVQARIAARPDSTSRVEFWIYSRMVKKGYGGTDQPEELVLYDEEYRKLLAAFDSFVAKR
jgi:hypothetical protein